MSRATLIDPDAFIEKNNLLEVQNTNAFSSGGLSFDDGGLWSETIFGSVGSKERKTKFGYIHLHSPMINPIMYKTLLVSSEAVRNIILEKQSYVLHKDGTLTLSDIGDTGVLFLLKNHDKINFENISKKDKRETGKFIEENKKLVFINNYLIMPAGIRDFSSQKKDTKQFSSEINTIYERIVTINNQLRDQSDDDLRQVLIVTLQKMMNSAFEWIRDRFSGKQGIMRGSILKRTLDYSARIVAVSDCDIPLGCIGVPWHDVVTLYEPFFIHHLFKDDELVSMIEKCMGGKKLDSHVFHSFTLLCSKNPDNIDPQLRDRLIALGEKIVEGRQVLVKRDPVVSRNSYYAAEIVIMPKGRGAVTNTLTCGQQGLDYDGDCIALMPIFTEEGNEQAKKLNPKYSKGAWINTMINKVHYNLSLDATSTIYAATRS